MLPRRSHGVGSEPKITRTFCFLKFKLSAPRLRRLQQPGSRQKRTVPPRQSDVRPRADLGFWFVTASQGGAREAPRSVYPSLWKGGFKIVKFVGKKFHSGRIGSKSGDLVTTTK